MKTLLLGLGNPILTDDSVGIRLAADIAAGLGARAGLDVVPDCPAGGLGLLEVLSGYERVIVLDSIRTAGAVPGEWHRFTAESLRETIHLSCVHDANFATVLELGRRMGRPLPPDGEIHIFAVEVEENATFGETLSPRVADAYPLILEQMSAEIGDLLEGPPVLTSGGPCSRREGSRSSGSGT
jgi:hydrogenase maturation protease